MRFASLGSGSRGNATLVQTENTLLMVDCGFSLRETDRRLARLGVTGEQIRALLVTHEHTDHSSGVAALSRKYQIPVYMTHGTHASGRCENTYRLELIDGHTAFTIGDVKVVPVPVPHDAREPCQYVVRCNGLSLGILTDLGSITPHVVESYGQCQGLVLECNHDPVLLRDGPYPFPLKRRVGGDWGHLSNEQAASLLGSIESDQLQHLVIAHISEKNNTRESAAVALAGVIKPGYTLTWADQLNGFDWLNLA